MTTTAADQRTAQLETGKTSRIYAPQGMLGYGFPESSLEAALEWGIDLIAVDAGSTDPGPYYLGAGVSYTSHAMVKRDLGLLLVPAVQRQIPLVIGSAGGAGAAPHLAWCLEILQEIAREHDLHFRLAIIEADQDPTFLKRKLAAGDIRDLDTGRELTDADIDACSYIVGQMGYEPVVAALRGGADVVLAGRAFDAALSATLPIMRGVEPGLALHMGKIVECGSLVALPRTSDGVLAEIDPEQFTVLPADPAKRCTVETVSAHTMYEKADPYKLAAPGGYIDLTEASFERVDDRSVKVAGSVFVPSPQFWIKLEGSALVGYRSVCLAGVRDPILISQLDDVLERVRLKLRNELSYSADQYQLLFRVYGRDAVMGDIEPYAGPPSHELGLVIEVIADTQEIADTVCALARSGSLHLGYEGRIATSGNLAFPYSPAEFPAPPVYEFRIYHLVRVDDPCELFPHPLGVAVSTVNIREVAQVVRSKNAGPFRLTLDILFKEREVYDRVKHSGAITAATIAGLYGIPVERVTDFVWFDPGKALKATLVRSVSSGSVGDTDVYGAQQHAPLLGLELPREVVG